MPPLFLLGYARSTRAGGHVDGNRGLQNHVWKNPGKGKDEKRKTDDSNTRTFAPRFLVRRDWPSSLIGHHVLIDERRAGVSSTQALYGSPPSGEQ